MAKRKDENRWSDRDAFVLVELFDQAFSIGTSCVFLAGGLREMRAAPRFRVELLSRKAFAGLRVHRTVSESAKKTGGGKAAADGTR